jgi:ParB-like chromosome segregation protein Spo0J
MTTNEDAAPQVPMISDLEATLITLEQAQAHATTAAAYPTRLPLASIALLPEAFNVRGQDLSEQHIGQLVRSLASVPDLTAILVLPTPEAFYLIDGHHRLAAYRLVGRLDVPVEVYRGTPREAVLEATSRNTRAALQMDNAQRQDCAWRLVNAGFMHDDVSAASGISRPQVTIMRRVKRALGEAALELTSWRRAMRQAKGTLVELTPEEMETMLAAQAQGQADRLFKEFGTKMARNPEVAANALAIYFGRNLDSVVGYLMHHLTEEQAERIRNPEF